MDITIPVHQGKADADESFPRATREKVREQNKKTYLEVDQLRHVLTCYCKERGINRDCSSQGMPVGELLKFASLIVRASD